METNYNSPIALVIGLCSHGLAMARALRERGIEVHAFEVNHTLPGVWTNSAIVHYVSSVKTQSLIRDLLSFRAKIPASRPIVLFPTNDNNVSVIGNHIGQLTPHFLLSWQHCTGVVLPLLLKSNIEQRCREQGLNYPQSYTVESLEQIDKASELFEFPVIIKPVQPQSTFKALKCDSPEQLNEIIRQYKCDLPILVQHWISGTDTDLYFGVLYLDKGKVISRFVGNKLESYPAAMGQTTVAVTCGESQIISLTEQFFAGLNMTGPVSVEFKRDHLGRFWVIEPTVGRTDFWIGLCITAGCNLLHTEYQQCLGLPYSDTAGNYKPTIWFDSERDITAFFRHFTKSCHLSPKRYQTTFSYLSSRDIKPSIRGFKQVGGRIFKILFTRITNKFTTASLVSNSVHVYTKMSEMPDTAIQLLKKGGHENIFISKCWYELFCRNVGSLNGQIRFYCLFDETNKALAVLPMWLQPHKELGLRINRLTSLANYYSPGFDIAVNTELISRHDALTRLMQEIKKHRHLWDIIDIFPTNEDFKNEIIDVTKQCSLPSFPYWLTKNYYQPINCSYEEYFNRLPSIVKHTIARKMKKLAAEKSWSINVFSGDEKLDDLLKQYHSIYRDSWKVNEPFPEFINGLIKLGAEKSWLRIGLLSIDSKPVAVQFWLVANDTAYIYKLAYIKDFRHFSPGTILTNHLLKHVIEVDRVKRVDYLTGSDAYKSDWMSKSRNLYGIQIVNRRNFIGQILYLKNMFAESRKILLP